jgi:hypothetical protein
MSNKCQLGCLSKKAWCKPSSGNSALLVPLRSPCKFNSPSDGCEGKYNFSAQEEKRDSQEEGAVRGGKGAHGFEGLLAGMVNTHIAQEIKGG